MDQQEKLVQIEVNGGPILITEKNYRAYLKELGLNAEQIENEAKKALITTPKENT